ncbi:MAG: hypothetical protein H6713_35835 [Myxococcales bacterium]|nr:hypothetical protein [Myxococcales bacterium]
MTTRRGSLADDARADAELARADDSRADAELVRADDSRADEPALTPRHRDPPAVTGSRCGGASGRHRTVTATSRADGGREAAARSPRK